MIHLKRNEKELRMNRALAQTVRPRVALVQAEQALAEQVRMAKVAPIMLDRRRDLLI
jgi:hypothetical protein